MFLFVFLVLFFFSCSVEPGSTIEVVARVNNQVLTKEDLNHLVGDAFVGPKTMLHATNRWVEKTLLHDAAIKAGLKKDKNLIKQKNLFYKDLLISSFININTRASFPVLKKEVSDYYNKNKKGFARASEEVLVKHFVLKTKKEAYNIKKMLKKSGSDKNQNDIINKHNPETRLLKEGLAKDNLVGFVFGNEPGRVLGPKKHGLFYHVFKVLKVQTKGSIKGLELVYDEIHQRLYKEKEALALSRVLDSLYANADVFISSGVFE